MDARGLANVAESYRPIPIRETEITGNVGFRSDDAGSRVFTSPPGADGDGVDGGAPVTRGTEKCGGGDSEGFRARGGYDEAWRDVAETMAAVACFLASGNGVGEWMEVPGLR